VIGDLDDGPPFRIRLLFVLAESAVREVAEFEIAQLIEAAGFAVDGMGDAEEEGANVIIQSWVAAPPSRIPLSLYLEGVGLPLRYESLRGEEVVGAEPFDAETA
jgi:hypothetical protein